MNAAASQSPASKYAPLVSTGSWFSSLPAALQEQLLAMSTLRHLRSGQNLFSRGDAPDGIYCVVQGAIRITGIAQSGKEALLAIVEQPHWFGEISLFDGQPRTHDAWAEGATVLLHVLQDELIRFLEQHPVYWRQLGQFVTQKIRTTFLLMEEAALLPATERLARRLITIAGGYGEWKDRNRRTIQIPQEQLALMLSLSRQTVNQILKQFEAEGAVLLTRGNIEVVDLDKLRSMAGP